MMKAELEQKLGNLNTEIQQVNQEIKTLAQQKIAVLDRGQVDTPGYVPGTTATQQLAAIREDSRELQDRLEDLTVMRTAIEGKIQVYKSNAPKAAELRKRIAEDLYPKAARAYNGLRAKLVDVCKFLDELDQLNRTMSELGKQQDALSGEPMNPQYVAVGIEPTFAGFLRAGAQLVDVPATIELKLQSEITPATKKPVSTVKDPKKTKPKGTADVGTGYEDTTTYVGGREALHKPEVGAFEDLAKQPGVNIGSTAVVDPTDPRIKSAGGGK